MSIKIKLYILCTRLGTELGEPAVFPSRELAYKEMEVSYYNALEDYRDGHYNKEESGISGESAVIVTNDDWQEWTITECELEISNSQEIMQALREHLVSHSTAFAKYVQEAPQKFGAFAGWLLEVRDLLKTAVNEVAAEESVSGDV